MSANCTAILSNADGPMPGAVVNSVEWGVDSGWSWSADINAGFNRYLEREDPFTITLTDGLGHDPLETPVLVAMPTEYTYSRSIASPDFGSISGQDRTTNRTKIENQSFPTFLASSTGSMVSAIATRLDITINGVPNWWIDKEDIKQIKLASKLEQILGLAAYDLVAELDGSLQCRAWEYNGGTLSMPWSTLKGNRNAWSIYTGVRVGKFSSTGDASEQYYEFNESGAHALDLESPLNGPVSTDLSSVDGLGAVSFFAATDAIVEFNSYKPLLYQNPYPLSILTATKMVVVVDPIYGDVTTNFPSPVRIRVNGTPPDSLPDGIDREFLYPPVTPGGGADVSLGSYPSSTEKIDSLWPSQAYAYSRRPYILAKLNSTADTLTMTRDIIDVSPRLLQRFTIDGHAYKVWSIKWDVSGNTTELYLVRV